MPHGLKLYLRHACTEGWQCKFQKFVKCTNLYHVLCDHFWFEDIYNEKSCYFIFLTFYLGHTRDMDPVSTFVWVFLLTYITECVKRCFRAWILLYKLKFPWDIWFNYSSKSYRIDPHQQSKDVMNSKHSYTVRDIMFISPFSATSRHKDVASALSGDTDIMVR